MFNRTISDDLATMQEIEDRAVERARPTNLDSHGNSSGSYSVIQTPISPYDPNSPNSPFPEAGITEEGVEFYPFIFTIDTFENEGAYIVFSNKTKSYGN